MNYNYIEGLDLAVLIPCYNEAASIQQVIRDLRSVLPQARIVVFDNNSTDQTASLARAEGCEVIEVALKGKGNVVRRMFSDIEADVYLMVDGDGTYEASAARPMVNLLCEKGLDMVVGTRHEKSDSDPYRPGHRFGNKLLTGATKAIFGGFFTDMLSGYRVFSRRYAKSFPALSKGFEIETELTIHALELRMPCGEIVTAYGDRMEGSSSKLSTYKDGLRILKTIFKLFKSERPFSFFSLISAFLICSALLLAFPLLTEYLATGLVPRMPTALLACALVLSGVLAFSCGLILQTVTQGRNEIKRLFYLSVPVYSRVHRSLQRSKVNASNELAID